MYAHGVQSLHRRVVYNCAEGFIANSQTPSLPGPSFPLRSTFEFQHWTPIPAQKVMMKKVTVPTTFFNSLYDQPGVLGISLVMVGTFANGISTGAVEQQMLPNDLYQLTPQNFLDLCKYTFTALANLGGTWNTPPVMTFAIDADDQQLGITYTTVGQSLGASNLVTLVITFNVYMDPMVLNPAQQDTLLRSHFGQIANSPQAYVLTANPATFPLGVRAAFLIMEATWGVIGGTPLPTVIYKPEVMNFLSPPYLLVHADFMTNSVIPYNIMASTQTAAIAGTVASQFRDVHCSTILGLAYLTNSGMGQGSQVGRYMTTEADGLLDNYITLNPFQLQKPKIWFTYPDNTPVYFNNVRPIVELYVMD